MSNDWGDVEKNIERHACGCWTWGGAPLACNVFRYVAEAHGTPLPAGQLYRMPGCVLVDECVNPSHIGTSDDFMRAVHRQLDDASEEPKMPIELKVTARDKRFLKSLKISWD
jgi:hypothetical protein